MFEINCLDFFLIVFFFNCLFFLCKPGAKPRGPEGWRVGPRRVGPRRVGAQAQKKWEPEGWGPEGWGPEGVGGPEGGSLKFHAFFSLSRRKIRAFLPSLSVFSWNFVGLCEDRGVKMCTFGLSGCGVKPRRLRGHSKLTDAFAVQHDALMRRALSQLLSVDPSSMCWDVASLPFTRGGMGCAAPL